MKWAKRIGLVLVAGLFAVVLAGFVFERWSRHAAARRYPPAGKVVEVDGLASHLYCTGEGGPTVIFESGLETDGALGWSKVQPKVAEFTRVCSYDRAGYVWSAARGGVRDARTIARELGRLLATAGERPPYVMVGHSLGGSLTRVFAAQSEPGAVKGFVFVDVSPPDLAKRDPAALDVASQAEVTLLAEFGVWRLVDEGAADLPEEVRRSVLAFSPQGSDTWLAEARALSASFAQATESGSLGDRPLVVLTAVDKPPERQAMWRELQDDLATLSTNTDHRLISNCGHYIHHERPELVVTAVRDVVTAVRDGAPIRHETALHETQPL